MAQMFWATPTAQSAVGQSATNVPTESGVAETTVSSSEYDARKLRTKAFTKMKGFKGDEKARPDWR